MRRERSQSSDRGRPHVPRWDNPSGQLPGTGIRSGIDSGLYGFSHGTSRRRDFSVPQRSPDLLCLMACQVVFHLLEQFRT